MPSSGLVGCQSIGCKRSSNLEERANFHLRKIVQMMAIPAMDEATTMITVRTLPLVEVAPLFLGAEDSVASACAWDWVAVTVRDDGPAMGSLMKVKLSVSDV